jgi:S1-C subfamily serine protease
VRSKKSAIAKGQMGVLLILLTSVFLIGACNRGNSEGIRLATTSDPGINNAPVNSGAPNNSPLPAGSYADVVSRVSPAVITIHSEMRVRQPQQYPFMVTRCSGSFLAIACRNNRRRHNAGSVWAQA